MSPAHRAEFNVIVRQFVDLSDRAGLKCVVLATEDDENVIAASNLVRDQALKLAYSWSVDSVNVSTSILPDSGTKS